MTDLSHINLSKTGLVFDSRSGDSYQINDSAIFIIKLLQLKKSTTEASNLLAENYNLTNEQALSDILEFKNHLSIIGLI